MRGGRSARLIRSRSTLHPRHRYRRQGPVVVATVSVLIFAVGCSAGAPSDGQRSVAESPARASPAQIPLPPTPGRFDYQIGGAYPPADDVEIVSRDHSEDPAAGRYNICYVNAYKAQPDGGEAWLGVNADLILRDDDGEPVIDEVWDEAVLDTSQPGKRARIAEIVGGWIDECARSGFDAVEPDNLDSWTRAANLLTESDNVAMATLLIERAHRNGLAIAQKNTIELGVRGREIGFDFAFVEQCGDTRECADYAAIFGRNVIDIEYDDTEPKSFRDACEKFGETFSIVLRDRNVVPKGEPDYVNYAC